MSRRLTAALVLIATVLILTGCGSSGPPEISGQHELKLLAAVDSKEISPGRYLVGWVMFNRPNSNEQVQTIAIEMDEPYTDWVQFGVEQLDVNFDGSLDIGVRQYKGAQWARMRWWLYDPQKSQFYTNSLTQELSKLIYSEFTAEPESKTITATVLVGVEVMERTYKVVTDRLEVVASNGPETGN